MPRPEFKLPPLDEAPNVNYGQNFDGAIGRGVAKYGVFYTDEEINALGYGDWDTGLDRIAEAISRDDKTPEELEDFSYRPLQEELEELLRPKNIVH